MNILVIGGAGFIGSHTVDRLLEKGHHVRILDSLEKPVHRKGKPKYIPDDVDFILGDVREKSVLKKALDDIEVVYNFAAYQDYSVDFSKYFSVNTVGTSLIYESIVEYDLPIKKVIVASSQSVMGEGKYACLKCNNIVPKNPNDDFFVIKQFFPLQKIIMPPIRLENQLNRAKWDFTCSTCSEKLLPLPNDEYVSNPQNQYGISKLAQELIAINLGKRYSIQTVCLRYSIVQGARQSFYNAYSGAMRIFCLNLFFDNTPIIFEDGNQIRDYINIKDVVDANILVLEKEQANYEIFNVGGGIPFTVNDFYKKVAQIFGKDLIANIPSEYRYGDTRHIFSDISKLKKLGWSPSVSIEQSIREYKTYLEEQIDIDNIYEYQSQKMKEQKIIRKVNS